MIPEKIIITDIQQILTITFSAQKKACVTNRPCFGLAFSLSGEITYLHEHNKINLTKNQIVLIPKNSTYDFICNTSGSFAVINFLAEDISFSEFILLDAKNIEFFKNEFAIMHNNFNSDSVQKNYDNFSSLYKMFSELARISNKSLPPDVLQKALDFIDDNIASPSLCNTQIAEHLKISEVYLRKLFSQKLKISANSYLQTRRIEKAKMLLTETPLSITDVSLECGYSCIYYFCNNFKKFVGCTPTEFRNKNRAKFF